MYGSSSVSLGSAVQAHLSDGSRVVVVVVVVVVAVVVGTVSRTKLPGSHQLIVIKCQTTRNSVLVGVLI